MLLKSVSVTSHKERHLGEEPSGSTALLCLQPTQTAAWGGCFKANCSQSIKQRDKLEAVFPCPWQLADACSDPVHPIYTQSLPNVTS